MSVPTFIHPGLLLPKGQQPDFTETAGLQPSLLLELYGPAVRALPQHEINYVTAREHMSQVAVACYANLGGGMHEPIFFERLHQELNWYERVKNLSPYQHRRLYLRETLAILYPSPYLSRRWEDVDPVDVMLNSVLEMTIDSIKFPSQVPRASTDMSMLARELWTFMCARVSAEDVAEVELPGLFGSDSALKVGKFRNELKAAGDNIGESRAF